MLHSSGGKEPEEQLRAGLKLVEAAFEDKKRAYEHETRVLRSFGNERQAQVALLERRVADLETQVQQAEQRMRELANENNQLANEKAALFQEVRMMQEKVGKLDQFKKSILQSIQDEPDIARPDFAQRVPLPKNTITPSSHQLPPPSRAPTAYTAISPTTSPGSRKPPPPPSSSIAQDSCATSLPTDAPETAEEQAQPIDGKDFFRAARLRLTYEQFNSFLTSIKRLNDHAQNREETLAQAQQIFGEENQDLFTSFRSLLTKHGLN